MKRNRIRPLFSGVAVVALMALFASCEEEDYRSYMPTFSRLEVDFDAPSLGDSITITAHQASKGRLLNGTTYTWEITDSHDSVVYKTTQKVIYDNNPSNPVLGYRIPRQARTGRYEVKFHARYKYSGQGGTLVGGGILGGESESGNGTVRPSASGATYGECKGKVRFDVQNP